MFKVYVTVLLTSINLLGFQGPCQPNNKKLIDLLPANDNKIISTQDISGGKNNNITICTTSTKKVYLLRSIK